MRLLCLFGILGGVFECVLTVPYEHVILSDCTSSSFIRLSHMAYYSETLNNEPKTLTVVPTARNTTAIWIRNASDPLFATFPDGALFSANLSATAKEGDFAGTGTNGWGSFNCWKYHVKDLYHWYNDVTCDAVYDCNRQMAAGDGDDVNATETATAAVPIPTGNTTGGEVGSEGRGESKKSDDIALGVGIGIGVPSLIAAVAAVWYASRRVGIREHFHSHLGGLTGGDGVRLEGQGGNENVDGNEKRELVPGDR